MGEAGGGEGGGGSEGQHTTQNIEWLPYFVDTTTNTNTGWDMSGVYVRHSEEILGEPEKEDNASLPAWRTQSLCFNCGSPDHTISSCPEPINREVVSLSRTLRQFLQENEGLANWKRIHVVEEWRQQRLEWLETLQPGKLKGHLLREALGGEDGDWEWLKNMTCWGYPPGWIGKDDPRNLVRERIWNEDFDGIDGLSDDELFLIHGDDGDIEEVSSKNIQTTSQTPETPGSTDSVPLESDKTEQNTNPENHTTRWARYPNTYFNYELLPVYNGLSLPGMEKQNHEIGSYSSTYTSNRQDLWQRIISGENFTSVIDPPVPPPPSEEPPPLPPPSSAPPPPPPSPPHDSGNEMDMDMSDSD